MSAAKPRFFFIHVMKTGGGTFAWHMRQQFRRHQVYPDPDVDTDTNFASRRIDYLLGLDADRRREIRAYSGHFPFVVSTLLDPDLVRITILRHPVRRTISYLKHCAHYHPQHKGLPLEEIYEDPFFFPGFILDHQTKLFSMTADDPMTTFFQAVDIDRDRLELAKENLARVEVLGLTDHFEDLVDEMTARFGWSGLDSPDIHVSDDDREVPPDLVRRIEEDNALDLEFYEYAVDLWERRGAGDSAGDRVS